MLPQRLLSPHLILRHLEPSDQDLVIHLLCDQSVMQHLGGAHQVEQAHAAYIHLVKQQDNWVISIKTDGKAIGLVTISGIDDSGPVILLQAGYWRQSLATQAAACLLCHRQPVPAIVDRPHLGPMAALMKRLGFNRRDHHWQAAPQQHQACIQGIINTWQQQYRHRVKTIHQALAIPPDYASRHQLALIEEARGLCSIGMDIYQRQQWLQPGAAQAWQKMDCAAKKEGVELQVVSAWRSLDYQAALINRKIQSGQGLRQILRVSAAPGYSEHHSGRALDLGEAGYEPLDEAFETSAAYKWLKQRAASFGYRMSYPRDNPHGLAYEPWHWAWQDET